MTFPHKRLDRDNFSFMRQGFDWMTAEMQVAQIKITRRKCRKSEKMRRKGEKGRPVDRFAKEADGARAILRSAHGA